MPPLSNRRRRAFTLLEIMLAVAILSLIGATIYQFVGTTLDSARFYVTSSERESSYAGLRRLVESQLADLPAGMSGSLVGLNIHSKASGQRDALQLVCPAGNSVLTPASRGYYEVTLGVREFPRGSGKFALGMDRRPHEDDEDDEDDDEDTDTPADASAQARRESARAFAATRAALPTDWVKLVDGVQNLEIAYFDSRLNGWVDKWTDQTALPNLVRLRLLDAESATPYEMVLRVPGGGVRRDAITQFAPGAAPGANGQNGQNGQPVVRRPVPGGNTTRPK